MWCSHNWPVPAGYLTTVLDVAGTAVTIINLHMMPHFEILQGTDSDTRTHQFGELSRFADIVSKATASVNAPAAVVLAGDFNEDAYNLKLLRPSSVQVTVDRQRWVAPCSMIGRDGRLATMFKQIGLDLHSACVAGKIGTPTWDPTNNDLANLFDGGKLEILDYIVRHSYNGGTGGAVEDVGEASVLTLAAATPWPGTFCESSVVGTVLGTFSKKVTALTDHQAVLTRIPIPVSNAASYGYSGSGFGREPLAEVLSKLDDALARFDKGGAQEAACGQKDTKCLFDEHCCVGQNVWDFGPDLECSFGECEPCSEKGDRCAPVFSEGSDCCRYKNSDYKNTGRGLRCKLSPSLSSSDQGECVSVYSPGTSCKVDAECDSQDCCYFDCDHDCWLACCN